MADCKYYKTCGREEYLPGSGLCLMHEKKRRAKTSAPAKTESKEKNDG